MPPAPQSQMRNELSATAEYLTAQHSALSISVIRDALWHVPSDLLHPAVSQLVSRYTSPHRLTHIKLQPWDPEEALKRTRMQPLNLALMADARPLIGLSRPLKPTVCHCIVHGLNSIKLPPNWSMS